MITVGLLAGGKGERVGGGIAKQFLSLKGRPMIAYPIEVMSSIEEVDEILVACNPDYIDELSSILKEIKNGSHKIRIISGGNTRHESVVNILNKILESRTQSGDKFILHEAARPLITTDLIREHIKGLDDYSATNTLMPVVDTIMLSKDGEYISEVTEKTKTYYGQNPQGYRVMELIDRLGGEVFKVDSSKEVDLCTMFLKKGGQVKIIRGNERLFKVTYESDLDLVLRYL